ncbi:FANCD2 opposite strand protein [Latimeria chalumnae]|uniref:FANCD2 opposite strand n=1 Tax=Latimeria chalumnae TaxID=7897 RepID=H3BFC7_LATCH|nr:PREDICTED: FANCD2 opposite strand protein [Latimeria chalumnae]|eukprot:XP_014344224.1 PREDICTED: FANCD2 opposite strand protein [Latimeria chalumnae]
MAGYELWAPWTPLDESFQWIRQTRTRPSRRPLRSSRFFLHTPTDLEVDLCFQEVALVEDRPDVGFSQKPHSYPSEVRATVSPNDIFKPQPVKLCGLDSVFGRIITVQAPRWTGTFRVSDRSAFSKVIARDHVWPTGLKEPQIQMMMSICKQLLRSILLIYANYKTCTFALKHSR